MQAKRSMQPQLACFTMPQISPCAVAFSQAVGMLIAVTSCICTRSNQLDLVITADTLHVQTCTCYFL